MKDGPGEGKVQFFEKVKGTVKKRFSSPMREEKRFFMWDESVFYD